jgi:hypothetical protein
MTWHVVKPCLKFQQTGWVCLQAGGLRQVYHLHLPRSPSHFHPVFPVIKLTPALSNPTWDQQPVPPMFFVRVRNTLKLSRCWIHICMNWVQFLIKWEGVRSRYDPLIRSLTGFLFGCDPFPRTPTYSSLFLPRPSPSPSCEHMLVTIIPHTSYYYDQP